MSYGEARLFLERYGAAIAAAGGVPFYLPYPAAGPALDGYLAACDGFVATGGEDVDPREYGGPPPPPGAATDRARDALELPLLRRAVGAGRPVLGICRGAQALAVALGGRLYQDLPREVPGALAHEPAPAWLPDGRLAPCRHDVTLAPDSRLAAIVGRTRLTVSSYHHQAVREPGRGARVAARAPDGVAEAIEVAAHPFAIGVQWHPELMLGDDGAAEALFDAFVGACREATGGGLVSAGAPLAR